MNLRSRLARLENHRPPDDRRLPPIFWEILCGAVDFRTLPAETQRSLAECWSRLIPDWRTAGARIRERYGGSNEPDELERRIAEVNALPTRGVVRPLEKEISNG